MADRGRYEAAMFWLAFGTAAAVIGLALMTIGVTRSASASSLFASPWFDGGAVLLGIGVLLLLWALGLYVRRRRDAGHATERAPGAEADPMVEAVRGYYREREKLFSDYREETKDRS